MTDAARADYELPHGHTDGHSPNGTSQAQTAATTTQTAGPRPTPQLITVTLRRQIWTEQPRGTYEIAVSETVTPDPAFRSADNLDALHRLLSQRLDSYLGAAVAQPSSNGSH